MGYLDEQTASLIQRAVAGDDVSAERLYATYHLVAFRTGVGLLSDLADAEEVVQDAFVYAFRNLSRYDRERSSFQTWLLTILICRCRNKRRRKLLETIPLQLWKGRPDQRVLREVEEGVDARGVKADVWRAVKALPPRLAEAVVLRYFAGLHYKEMGDIVGCNPKTAESRVRLAIKALRERLSEEGVGSLQEFWETSRP